MQVNNIYDAEMLIKMELEEELNKEVEKMKKHAWKSDIEPVAYYTRDITELAKERINYEEKQEAIKELTHYARELPVNLLPEWFSGKIDGHPAGIRKELMQKYLAKVTNN